MEEHSMHAHHMEHSNHSSHESHMEHAMGNTLWDRLKMSMTMTMGMDHTGIAGREMAHLMEVDIRNKFFFSLLFTLPILAYSMGEMLFGWNLPKPIPKSWILFLLATPVFFWGGWLFIYSAYHALKKGKLDMSVLIAVGVTAAYGFSVALTVMGSMDSYYEAAAMLITFVLFGHWMEMRSRRGTTDALQALFALVPPKARVLRDGQEVLVDTAEIKIGESVVLKPGDKIAVDGEVVEGESTIDESLVTGESMPVTKIPGNGVIAGTINLTGSLVFKATKVGEDTALANIVKLVETAQNSKAPGQRIADRFAGYLVILAVGSGVLTFIVWFFLVHVPLLTALTFAISAVVIACPDALGLATPTAVAVGTGIGAKFNILIKDAPTLEQVSKIQAVVFDKTGTLTAGKPKVTEIVPTGGFTEEQVLAMIAAAEKKSSHPLSLAVLDAVHEKNTEIPENIDRFSNLSGLGVEAVVDGKTVLVGTQRLMESRNITVDTIANDIARLLNDGQTLMILAVDGEVKGLLGASDPIRESSMNTIKKLNDLGIETVMITGDNSQTARIVGEKLGIQRVFAEVMPEDKAQYVKKLQDEHKFVAMVGDGVNDAPALAQANIGIAIGAGTDVAVETAKVVLMRSDPVDVLRAIQLSKATVRKMKQNLFWASIYNLLAIPVAAGVLYPSMGIVLRPEIAALLMSISSIIVAVNAVLLKREEKRLVAI